MKALALALVLWLALAPLAALAADEAHGGGHAAEETAGHGKEVLYEWINLAILAGVLGYFARKPIGDYLATRRDTIAKNIASSEELLREAERRLAEWNEKATRLDADVQRILESTRKGAEAEKAAILADAEATAARIRQGAAGVVLCHGAGVHVGQRAGAAAAASAAATGGERHEQGQGEAGAAGGREGADHHGARL